LSVPKVSEHLKMAASQNGKAAASVLRFVLITVSVNRPSVSLLKTRSQPVARIADRTT